ncbi:Putative uncharacterized protein [Taphrina deformans PYCC 5710]|uniref:BolA domain protein n=1 Tax=Taphrina deformans (strain PYCC 5710 / ATCC 11124 / CBS 356.35 / IMI 108563 / JCM 9778 / NBRC 8474) TaxID=1097556 RepID=R4X7I4_TAPDE|nr:Putative uncharacterized protein [Taphrina deformans PYCC 5710]|eukprot:CCG81058.1 Putative uncharacterized protein [Taphrina deformans PYCC 5710]
MATQSSLGPLEQVIRSKLTTALAPSLLEVHNDSHMHRHHAAMANSTSPETHFRITVVSDTFDGQRLAARHRVVYGLLRDEMAREGGIHALQLRLKTRAEEVRDREGGVAGTRAETCRNKTGER